MNERFEVCWDWSNEGNVAHIGEHDVTPKQVEQVLARGFHDRQRDRSHQQRWVVRGYTDEGEFLIVVVELDWEQSWNCWAVYPITAFFLE